MAQMPIYQVTGRAQVFPPPPVPNAPAPLAAPAASASSAGEATQAFDPGAIAGGKLRPGAVEQMTFRQRMMALNRADAPTGQTAPRAAPQTAQATARPATQAAGPLVDTTPRAPLLGPPPSQKMPSIPTLTPAQLAALGVDISALPELQQDPAAAQAAPKVFFDPATEPAAISPEPASPETIQADPAGAAPAGQTPVSGEAAADTAAGTAAAAPQTAQQAAQQAALPPGAANEYDGPQCPMPGSRMGKDGVWELPRNPDRDERDWLKGMNARWRIVENPESVKLFLGEDGKFGFDDLLDVINPLQHIPLVNIAYRKLTGDTVDGAAQLLGAIPFGPLSVASNLADIALRSGTGEGLAENAIAMIFGGGAAGTDPDGDIATASGRMEQVAEIRRGSNK